MNSDFNHLHSQTIEPELCVRCGVCAGVCPVEVIIISDDGYPKLSGDCIACGLCVSSCPGAEVDFPKLSKQVFGVEYDPKNVQGHVENMFVAHSTKNVVRDAGTSGGLVTGLLLHLLKIKKIEGAIVVGFDSGKPWLSKGLLATTPDEIVNAAKSKYSITPSMEILQILRKRRGKYAIVALPCQVHGLRKLEKVDPNLSKKIHCILGLMCHCNLERNAAAEVIETKGVKLSEIAHIDYRGGKWPGNLQATKKDLTITTLFPFNLYSYINVMFRLYGARRCNLCFDAMAEFADLSFGDFWASDYNGKYSDMERNTLVLQRTPIGATILDEATKDGAITLDRLPEERASKRTLNMARGKKRKALTLLWHKNKKGESIPNYHFTIPKPSSKSKKVILKSRIYSVLQKPSFRKLILRILFSPVGGLFDFLNRNRKKLFYNLHGN